MRKTFITSLCERATDKTFLIVGDVGYSVIEPFIDAFPDSYLNAGVAEQAMTGVAAGLALQGHKVFTYSIANFNTIRCLEQIRNDVCYHNLDVTVVSVGGGFVYGSGGYSHHAIQDIALMGSLPNMTLLLPADVQETAFCVDYAMNSMGPKYLRLGKNNEPEVHAGQTKLEKINILYPRTGVSSTQIACVTVGTIASLAQKAIHELDATGHTIDLITCPIIDSEFGSNIREVLTSYTHVLVCEEHVAGLGIAAMIHRATEGLQTQVFSIGVQRDIPKIVGDQAYLREQHGLGVESIKKMLLSMSSR
jgi:transketolase